MTGLGARHWSAIVQIDKLSLTSATHLKRYIDG